jgi:hypothetical protein
VKIPHPITPGSALAVSSACHAGCEAAEGVQVQELPPLDRPSPEARRGCPRCKGVWRFAGWELPSAEVGEAIDTLARPGDFVFDAQRLDSIAGAYRAPTA